MKEKIRFLKLINEYRSLEFEYQYINEVLRDAHETFEVSYVAYCEEHGINLQKLQEEQKKKVQGIFAQNTEEFIDTHGRFETNKEKTKHKDIFKSVAKKLHPDKIGQEDPRFEEYQESFKRAVAAIEQEQWGELFDVVDRYSIEINDYDEANKSIKTDIERMEKKIKSQKMTYSWLLHECGEDQVCKERIIKSFLTYMFGWEG